MADDGNQAFVLLNKKLKPIEHLSATPHEFRDLCYVRFISVLFMKTAC